MNAAAASVRDGELAAVPDPDDPARPWAVWRGDDLVGVLEQRRDGNVVWLVGRVDGHLVAEGPDALSVLRRLSCRATTRCARTAATSPVRT